MAVIKQIIGCFLLTLLSLRTDAQDVSLQYFHAESRNGKVYLRWAMSAGSTCSGIVILRSLDGLSYQRVGEIFGVCGSEDTAQVFDYTDVHPEENRRNYYQIVLGARVAVAVQSTYVAGAGSSYLYPNPATSNTLLYFDNKNKKPAEVRLFEHSGRQVDLFFTDGSEVKIDISRYPAGIYYYYVNVGEHNYRGGLTVIH